jgi:hypothetical protein
VAGLPHADDVRGVGQDGDVGQRVAVHGDEVGVIAFSEQAAAGAWRPRVSGPLKVAA